MKKQPELTALTRKALIDACFDLTAAGQPATVSAITERAGYNRCTFYRYFSDTEQLLDEVEGEICDAFRAALKRAGPAFAPPELIGSLAGVYRQYGSYLSVLLGEHGDTRFFARMKALMYPVAAGVFSSASRSGAVTELKVEFVLSAVLATVTKWYDMGQPIPAAELGGLMQDILQRGAFR